VNLAGQRKRLEWAVRPVASPIASLPITPNQITLIGFCFGIAAAALYADGRLAWAGAAFLAHSVLDLADGYAARKSGKDGVFGAVLDGLSDRYVNGLVLLAITAYAWDGNYALLGLGMVAAVSSIVNSFAKTQAYAESGAAKRAGGRIESEMEGVGAFGFAECAITLLACTAGTVIFSVQLMGLALAIVAVGSNVSLAQRLAFVGVKFGRKKA